MITVSFRWNAAESLRAAEAIATGEKTIENRIEKFSFADMTPEQRADVIELSGGVDRLGQYLDAGGSWEYDPNLRRTLRSPIYLDHYPALDELIALCRECKRTEAGADAQYKAAQDEIAKKEAERAEAERRHNAAVKEAIRQAHARAAEGDPAGALAILDEIDAYAHGENGKAIAEAEKHIWIGAYGSAHLKRAAGAGYDAQRRYATERAAIEAPGWILDFDGSHEWKNRSDPTPAALDLEDDARKLAQTLPGGAVVSAVVWLTVPPTNEPNPQYRQAEIYDFDPREAVTIDRYLGRYTLVKYVSGK